MGGKILIGLLALGAASACDRIPGTDAYKIKIGEKRAAAILSDPASAQFRDLSVRIIEPPGGQPIEVLCGEINGKNKLGAYAGFSPFLASVEKGGESDIMIVPPPTVTGAEVERARRDCDQDKKSRFGGPDGFICRDFERRSEEFSQQATLMNIWHDQCGKKPKA